MGNGIPSAKDQENVTKMGLLAKKRSFVTSFFCADLYIFDIASAGNAEAGGDSKENDGSIINFMP